MARIELNKEDLETIFHDAKLSEMELQGALSYAVTLYDMERGEAAKKFPEVCYAITNFQVTQGLYQEIKELGDFLEDYTQFESSFNRYCTLCDFIMCYRAFISTLANNWTDGDIYRYS